MSDRDRRAIAILEHVDSLLTDRNNWTKYTLCATDARGQDGYCLVGAVKRARARFGFDRGDQRRALWALRKATRSPMIRGFNDGSRTRVQDVRRVVKEAMASLEGATVADVKTVEIEHTPWVSRTF